MRTTNQPDILSYVPISPIMEGPLVIHQRTPSCTAHEEYIAAIPATSHHNILHCISDSCYINIRIIPPSKKVNQYIIKYIYANRNVPR